MGCKSIFWAEVAQSCVGDGGSHKKASRVVKHRKDILKGVGSVYEGCNLMILMPVQFDLVFIPT